MTLQETITECIDNWSKVGHPALLERFVLRNGRSFEPRPRIGNIGKAKDCFGNSARFVLSLRECGGTYVEGYVIPKTDGLWPIHHAWVSIDGAAMDPTLNADDYEYFGVSFDILTLRKELLRNKVFGLLDLGLGVNSDLMFRIDPSLRETVEKIGGAACRNVASA